MLRTGDSMILLTDGVTEARSHINRELYGDDRPRELIAGFGSLSAARIATAVIKAARAFSGGVVSDVQPLLGMPAGARGQEISGLDDENLSLIF